MDSQYLATGCDDTITRIYSVRTNFKLLYSLIDSSHSVNYKKLRYIQCALV